MYQVTNGQQGQDVKLSKEDVMVLLHNRKQKNGFAMATYEFPFMNGQLENMKAQCEKIVSLIDEELEQG